MLKEGDPEYEDLLELAERAVGPGLTPQQRNQWRGLVGDLLGRLNEASNERRGAIRAQARLDVQLLSPEERAGLFTSTISAGGLSMSMPDPPPIGTRLRVSIDTRARPQPLLATAEIVWVHPAGELGAFFVDLVSNDRELLEGVAVKQVLRGAAT